MENLTFEEKRLLIGSMTTQEKVEYVKEFEYQILYNELERRNAQRIELMDMVEKLSEFIKGMAR